MITKQIFKAGIILALAFGSLHAMAHTGPHITVGTGSDVAGSATPMVISLDYHGGNGAVGFQADITYDNSALTVDIASCGGVILGTALVSCSNPSPGIVRIFIISALELPDGTLGSLSFDVSSAPINTYALLIPPADELYTDINALPVASTGSIAGEIVITAAPLLDQTIDTFTSTPAGLTYLGADGTLAATATSGLAVTDFGAVSGPCTVAGNVVSSTGAGTCVVSADQAGDATYNPAPQVTLNIIIDPADQVITSFTATPPSGEVGDSSTLSATGGGSGLPVVFASSTPAICTVTGSNVDLDAVGTCIVTANQAGNTDYNAAPEVSLNIGVGMTDQVITGFAAVPVAGNAGGSSTLSATADSGLSVTFGSATPAVCTVAGSTVSYLTVGTCTVTADQAGDATYNAAPQVTLDIAVSMGDQTISGFTATPLAGYIGSTSNLSATASSGLSVSFASTTPAICTVAGNVVTYLAVGQCDLTADQAGDANYNAAEQVLLSIDVSDQPALPALGIPTLSPIGLGAMFLLMLGLGGLLIRRNTTL